MESVWSREAESSKPVRVLESSLVTLDVKTNFEADTVVLPDAREPERAWMLPARDRNEPFFCECGIYPSQRQPKGYDIQDCVRGASIKKYVGGTTISATHVLVTIITDCQRITKHANEHSIVFFRIIIRTCCARADPPNPATEVTNCGKVNERSNRERVPVVLPSRGSVPSLLERFNGCN